MPKDYPFETIEVILEFDSGPLAGKLFDALPLKVLRETSDASEPKPSSPVEKPVDLQHALEIMEQQAKRIQNAGWTIKQKATFRNELWQSHEISLVVDFRSERFFATLSGTSIWHDGAAPYISSREAYSYDGDILRSWKRWQHGKVPPGDEVIPLGTISKNRSEPGYGFKHDYRFPSGLIFFPPFILDTTTGRAEYFWKVLKKKDPATVTVVEEAGGIWRIEAPDELDGRFRVRYDPREGVISRMEWVAGKNTPFIPENAHRDVEIEFQKSGDFKVPKTVRLRQGCRDSLLSEFTFENVSINRKLEKKDFDLPFPEGTNVDDFVGQKTYLENKDGIDEGEAILRFFREWGNRTPQQRAGDTRGGGDIHTLPPTP